MGPASNSLGLPRYSTQIPPLEFQFQSELHHARVIDRGVNNAETGGRGDVLHLTEPAVSIQVKLRVVEQIEELSPELQSHSFPKRENEVLHGGEIGIHKPRPIQRSARRCAEFSRIRTLKCTGVEPRCKSMNSTGCCAAWISRNRSRLIGVTHFVGAIETGRAVPDEGNT